MKRKHLFELNAPDATKVFLAGDFTEWQNYAIPMLAKNNGGWQAAVRLEPGTYNYRFIVDGQWMNDPTCGACAPNPFGSQNFVVQVA